MQNTKCANGRTDGRPHGLGHDQSQGCGADRTPDRAMGKSKVRQEQHRQMFCARGCKEACCSSWPISGRKPAMPNWWRALRTSSRSSQRLSKGLGSMIPASATAKDGEGGGETMEMNCVSFTARVWMATSPVLGEACNDPNFHGSKIFILSAREFGAFSRLSFEIPCCLCVCVRRLLVRS